MKRSPETAKRGSDRIPVTELFELYGLLRKMQQQDRLAMASWLASEPDVLARMFSRSVKQFEAYHPNPGEPFHRGHKSPPPNSQPDAETGRGVACRLHDASSGPFGSWRVTARPKIEMALVDYELKPTRTTGGARFEDGRPATSGLTLDLLLRDPSGVPAVCEVKTPTDMDPFFAVVQALACTAELVPILQRERLTTQFKKLARTGPLDVFVLQIPSPADVKSTYLPQLKEKAIELIVGLRKQKQLKAQIRRLALLEWRKTDSEVEIVEVSSLST